MAVKVRHRNTYIAELDEGEFELTFEPIEDTIKVTKTENGFELRYLVQDEDPASPREWDNLGKMVCFHNRYDLGDKHNYKTEDYTSWEDMKQKIAEVEDALIIKQLRLYDHSGLFMSTGTIYPFDDPWDSMWVGFILATKEAVRKEFSVKRITKAIKAKVGEILEQEVKTYNQYLEGDVYGIVCEKYDKDRNQIDQDSVWGYYGREYAEEALRSEI
jgi:predicted DNA-binding transcriptional regulator